MSDKPRIQLFSTVTGGWNCDPWLFAIILMLVALGVTMVASSSLPIADRQTGSTLGIFWKHLLSLVLGLYLAWQVLKHPVEDWHGWGPAVLLIGVIALLLVLIPGVGRSANGATRWIGFGPLNFQPAEWMKLFVIIYLAGYLVRRQQEVINSFWGLLKPLILLGVAGAFIMAQPDFGTFAVMLITAMGMMFLGGAPLWQFATMLGLAATMLTALVIFEPYRLLRITAFMDPWSDPFNKGFQLTQALIALGRGEWVGVGLGNGIQKMYYLPEAHTDFLLAVIGEEFGLLGTGLIIFGFAVAVWRIIKIGEAAAQRKQDMGAYVAYGIGIWLGIQGFINIGVNLGMLPTKGLTLPFISYGSNSMMVTLVAVAMLLRLDIENHDRNCRAETARSEPRNDHEKD